MQSLYYYSGSLTGSNLYFIPNNDDYNQFYVYDITNLIVCSSLYQIMMFSGSNLLFSVPIEDTNLYYLPTTESFLPIPSFSPSPPLPPSFTSSSFNWFFTPDTNITSSSNILIITGSSVNIIQSQSSEIGFFQIASGSSISITVSGSGQFYTSSISIYNNTLLTSSLYVTSSNAPLTASFTASFEGHTYSITAETLTLPSIELKYNSIANIPVSPTNSLDNWNTYLSISASSIVNTGSSIYLLGGNIPDITASIFTGTGSVHLTNVNIIGANDLALFLVTTGSLTSFPSFQKTPDLQYIAINSASLTSSILPTGLNNLYYYDVCQNKISGSIIDIIQNVSQSIQILSCSFNNITGSIPTFPNYPSLKYLDCSNNKLSGAIKNPGNVIYYNCSNNQLSGSMLTSFSSSFGLRYFNCSNNAIVGDIPINTGDLLSLTYFNVSNNQLNGSIPSFTSSSILQTLDLSNNQFSGSFINLRNNTLLTYIDYSNNQIEDEYAIYNKDAIDQESNIPPLVTYYDCSYNFLSGTLDLSGSSNLVTFIANNNQFSGSICFGVVESSSLQGCTSLQTFNVSNNALSGSIPPLGDNINLSYFDARNNRLSTLAGSFTIPSTLTYFDLENNNLTTGSVEGIAEAFYIVFSGSAVSGTINVSGSGNAPPNTTAKGYFNDLTASGWTIYANNYP